MQLCRSIFLACFTLSSIAQSQQNGIVDPKNLFSLLLTPSPFYLEPGIEYRRKLNDKFSLQFRYSYQLFGYNIAANESLLSYEISNHTGHGSIIRAAAELNYRNLQTKARNDFMNSDIRTKKFTFQNTFIQIALNLFWGLITGKAKKEENTS